MPHFRLPSLNRLVALLAGDDDKWQAGDGREERLAAYVEAHARPGDPADAIRVIDKCAYEQAHLWNVGDEKGEILDEAIRTARPARVLELGAYCGYSALRMARAAPDAQIFSVELHPPNAEICGRVWRHAGVADRVTMVVGSLGDLGTVTRLEAEHGFVEGNLDFVFIDHHKDAYLPDLERIIERKWLRKGAVVVADNVLVPGAPEYLAHIRGEEGRRFRTAEHATHLEYRSDVEDLVLISEYLG